MLLWLLGAVEATVVTQRNQSTAIGILTLENELVNWTISIDEQKLPENLRIAEKKRCVNRR